MELPPSKRTYLRCVGVYDNGDEYSTFSYNLVLQYTVTLLISLQISRIELYRHHLYVPPILTTFQVIPHSLFRSNFSILRNVFDNGVKDEGREEMIVLN